MPDSIRLKRPLDLPAPLRSGARLVAHMERLLARDRTVGDHLSFLGAGCAPHCLPAVCDEIDSRGESLTAYSGHAYEEHGRFPPLFEYQSMMGELLKVRGATAPYASGKRRIEQTRYSWQELADETGIHTQQIAARAADFGVHCWFSHHPWIVPRWSGRLPATVPSTRSTRASWPTSRRGP